MAWGRDRTSSEAIAIIEELTRVGGVTQPVDRGERFATWVEAWQRARAFDLPIDEYTAGS